MPQAQWGEQAAAVSRDTPVRLNGAACRLTPEGGLWWPAERLLAVADLHLEKASSLARRHVFLPPYDTAATLARLAALVLRLAPARLVLLGDSFHDRAASARVGGADREALAALLAGREVTWVLGNHDPEPPVGLPGTAAEVVEIGPLVFRHEPSPRPAPGELAGHLHPAARVPTRGRALRRRCFVGDGTRLVLPAFGALAGGLNVQDEAFAPLFPAGFTAHVLGEAAVHAFSHGRCLPD